MGFFLYDLQYRNQQQTYQPIAKMRNRSPARKEVKKQQIETHKRQIQSTLNQLHKLQSQIYELQVTQNPHSSPPVKREIKQLAYLYENMTKPKDKNGLEVSLEDIRAAYQVMNPNSQHLQLKRIKQLMKDIYSHDFDVSLMTEANSKTIRPEEMFEFINYNQFDEFDPVQQAYNLFLDDDGNFQFAKYNLFNQKFGLPKVKNMVTLLAALDCKEIGLEEFRRFAKLNVQA